MQLYVLARTCGVNWGIACVPIDMHVNARAHLFFGRWHVHACRPRAHTHTHARARFTHRHVHRCANMSMLRKLSKLSSESSFANVYYAGVGVRKAQKWSNLAVFRGPPRASKIGMMRGLFGCGFGVRFRVP